MKILAVILAILLTGLIAFADQLIVPFDCYPKELQKECMERGYKLELDPIERTPESWGFLVNQGSQHTIYTYKGTTQADLEMLMDVYRDNTSDKEL